MPDEENPKQGDTGPEVKEFHRALTRPGLSEWLMALLSDAKLTRKLDHETAATLGAETAPWLWQMVGSASPCRAMPLQSGTVNAVAMRAHLHNLPDPPTNHARSISSSSPR